MKDFDGRWWSDGGRYYGPINSPLGYSVRVPGWVAAQIIGNLPAKIPEPAIDEIHNEDRWRLLIDNGGNIHLETGIDALTFEPRHFDILLRAVAEATRRTDGSIGGG